VNPKVALAFLRKLGFRADAVEDGRQVIEALEKIPYDLVLMDIQMPETDGYETTREIRRPDSRVINSSIPIIALTAYTMKRDQDLCMKVGMNDFVSKPIQLEVLKERIDRCISNTVASYMRP